MTKKKRREKISIVVGVKFNEIETKQQQQQPPPKKKPIYTQGI
jgi:hypothetical protein